MLVIGHLGLITKNCPAFRRENKISVLECQYLDLCCFLRKVLEWVNAIAFW